jgi:HAD superfamily hydrolase (TIGR01509 family)
MGQLQAALFDFDGTIFHSEIVHQQAVREVFEREFGQLVDDDESRSLIGLTYEERLLKLFARRGIDDDALVERLEQEARTLMRQRLDLTTVLVPGVADFMRAVVAAGWRVAVVSSAGHDRIAEALGQVGLRDFVSVIVGRNDVQRLKPDPEPYETALAALQVAPEAAIVFEDSPAGIASARAAGIRVVGVATTYRATDLAGADTTIQDFTGLQPAALQSLQ